MIENSSEKDLKTIFNNNYEIYLLQEFIEQYLRFSTSNKEVLEDSNNSQT